ncbi:hypothetical protein MKD35_39 [Aureococcus anophagefferens virus]|nr:hypothetical protein MKD35_39 [Aureococcus anophagefferens virus]
MSIESFFSNIEKKIVFFTGRDGVGKKYKISHLAKKYNIKTIDLDPLYNKHHIHFKKKCFFDKLKEIACKKNITSFFQNQDEVIVVHNCHCFDKAFFESLNSLSKIHIPIICIINTSLISERFTSFITKNSKNFNLQMSFDFIHKFIKKLDSKISNEEANEIIKHCNGNLIRIKNIILQKRITNTIDNSNKSIIKIDKHVVSNSFKILCDPNLNWIDKNDILKSQSSLFRMLIPNHICSGLDEFKNCKEKNIEIAINCFKKLKRSEIVESFQYSNILRFIFPTICVQNQTIKHISMTASNSNENIRIESDEHNMYLSYNLLKCFEKDLKYDKLNEDSTDIIAKTGKVFGITITKKQLSLYKKKYM